MFVVGRNVKVKVENGRLIIQCEIDVPGVSYSRALARLCIADTSGMVKVPNTNLSLDVYVSRPKPE